MCAGCVRLTALQKNRIGNEGIGALVEALQHNSRLEGLDLKVCLDLLWVGERRN